MLNWLISIAGSIDEDSQSVLQLGLSDELLQAARPQLGVVGRVFCLSATADDATYHSGLRDGQMVARGASVAPLGVRQPSLDGALNEIRYSGRVTPFAFDLLATCPTTAARAGVFHTPHGPIETPTFVPVGTLGSVKSLLPADVRGSGAQCVLANAYHLAQRPGADVVEALGGLHRLPAGKAPCSPTAAASRCLAWTRCAR